MAAIVKDAGYYGELLERRLQLFFGEATDTQARVYAQLDQLPPGHWSLTGTIAGPTSLFAQTLTSTHRLIPVAGGPPLLAEALILDPCFWTPAAPNLYTVNIELRLSGQPVSSVERIFGIRPLGAAGNSLRLENKRWVLRAIDSRCVPPVELSEWRSASAAMVIANPSDQLCEQASREGVLIVAAIAASAHLNDVLQRLARWPAVGLVVLSGACPLGAELKSNVRNVPLVQSIIDATEIAPAPWASAVLIDANQPELFPLAANMKKPIIVLRTRSERTTIAEARAQCDLLQRDMTPLGDFAGYLIGAP